MVLLFKDFGGQVFIFSVLYGGGDHDSGVSLKTDPLYVNNDTCIELCTGNHYEPCKRDGVFY